MKNQNGSATTFIILLTLLTIIVTYSFIEKKMCERFDIAQKSRINGEIIEILPLKKFGINYTFTMKILVDGKQFIIEHESSNRETMTAIISLANKGNSISITQNEFDKMKPNIINPIYEFPY